MKIDDLETKHFVLVHGGGFGAWCWYKTMTLLKEAGFAQYVKPLVDFLENLGDGQKVMISPSYFVCYSFQRANRFIIIFTFLMPLT